MKDRQKMTLCTTGAAIPGQKSGNEEEYANMKGYGVETLIQIIKTQNITIEAQKSTIEYLTAMLNDCGMYPQKLQKMDFLFVLCSTRKVRLRIRSFS